MAQKCEGIKKGGDRCGAWAIGGGTLCAGHSGLGIARDPAAYAQAGNEQSQRVRQERARQRKETLLDRIARLTEEKASEITQAYLDAGQRGDWRALEALVTRVHGKPVERVEVEAPADPLGVASMTAAERAALAAQVLEQHPHLAALIPRTARVQPDAQTLH